MLELDELRGVLTLVDAVGEKFWERHGFVDSAAIGS